MEGVESVAAGRWDKASNTSSPKKDFQESWDPEEDDFLQMRKAMSRGDIIVRKITIRSNSEADQLRMLKLLFRDRKRKGEDDGDENTDPR